MGKRVNKLCRSDAEGFCKFFAVILGRCKKCEKGIKKPEFLSPCGPEGTSGFVYRGTL